MKQVTPLLFLMLMGAFCTAFGSEIRIEKQIQAIQNAPQEQRYELMNALKKEMAEMTLIERSHIADILEQKRNSQINNTLQTQQMIEARKQELAQEMQSQTASRLSEYQSFLQRVAQEVHTRLIDPIVNPPLPFTN